MSPWFELIALMLSLTGLAAVPGDKAHEPFTMKVIASHLESPWEVLWGQDQFLWVGLNRRVMVESWGDARQSCG